MGYFTNKGGNVELESSMVGDSSDVQLQPVSSGGGYYQPVIMPSDKADLYDKIRPEDVVETVKYKLMGYFFNEQRQRWELNPVMRETSLSEVGATQIATLLFGVSNKSVSISKLKDDEIRSRTKYLVRTAMKKCLEEWKQFGIKSSATYPFVKEVVISIAFITLKQPEGAGVRTFIQGVTQENRTVIEQPKKEGVMGSIFRR